MCECSCWVKYPNPMHKNKNGKWKCVDDYECIRDLEIKMTKVGVSCVSRKTHCIRKEKKMLDVNQFKDRVFKKQLGYNNRTFLVGYYTIDAGVQKFEVIREGKTWAFSDLGEAVKKYNEISEIPK